MRIILNDYAAYVNPRKRLYHYAGHGAGVQLMPSIALDSPIACHIGAVNDSSMLAAGAEWLVDGQKVNDFSGF